MSAAHRIPRLNRPSYGRQLGRIGEALLAIAEHTDVSDYTGDQKSAVEDFKALMREIAAAKRRATQARATTARVVPSTPKTLGRSQRRIVDYRICVCHKPIGA